MIASQPGPSTLEDYLLATDLLPALIFIFMAGLFGFLPSGRISAATSQLGRQGLCFGFHQFHTVSRCELSYLATPSVLSDSITSTHGGKFTIFTYFHVYF